MKNLTKITCLAALLTLALTTAQGQMPPPSMPLGPSPHQHGDPGAVPGMPAMPAGHPSLDQLTGVVPATQPMVTGSLTIQVVAGSAGGVVTPDDAVSVVLYHRGTPIKQIDAKLDPTGKVIVNDIPVMPPVQALVSVKHAGLFQQVTSPELNPAQPSQSIEMKVFETTTEKPAWTIAMQHMIVQWSQDGTGARVTEMISASTPGDRAWLGDKAGDQHITMSIPLPANVEGLELGGSFDEDVTKIVNGNLITGGALFPGRSEYRITYTVPARNGALELPIAAPAAVGNLIVFLPADDVRVIATGLTGGDPVNMGEGPVRMYRAQNLAAGATATLSISGIKAAPAEGGAGIAVNSSAGMSMRSIAIGSALLVAFAGVGLILFRKANVNKA